MGIGDEGKNEGDEVGRKNIQQLTRSGGGGRRQWGGGVDGGQ
jgi:hypothetical protein